MKIKTWSAALHACDEQGELTHIGTYKVEAETRIAAEQQVMDEHWDARLDAASCSPRILIQQTRGST